MSNISVDYDVLNQRGSPAWFTDTFANIPTAGFVGRMFISTDTFAFYRDTGTGWDLIGGPGTGTITGSGVTGQVSFFNGTQVLAGNNNLFWDNTNSRLGINTTTPGQPLDIHSTGNTLIQLNNTTTANSNISFQNQNVAKWRVGNVYNGGANSFDIQNAGLSTNAISINSTTNNVNFGSTIGNGTFTYTLPSATGTLALTSNIPANPVGGTGTTDTLPKFTAASTIGNSNITDTGTLITLGINSYVNGALGIGTTSITSGNVNLFLAKNLTGDVNVFSVNTESIIQSDVTTHARYFRAVSSTAAAAFTLSELTYYETRQGTFGAGSTVGTQQGFVAGTTLIGGTNNYGFRGRIPVGTNRWNLYMDGTADNYLAGSLGIGSTSLTGYNLRISKTLTGLTSTTSVFVDGITQADSTNYGNAFRSSIGLAASATTANLIHYFVIQGSFGSGSSATNQMGIWVDNLTGATNNYGFYGNIASGANRWNLYMNGTADNYMAGSLGIGSTSLTGYTLRLSKSISGGTSVFAVRQEGTVQSDVTSDAVGFRNDLNTTASAFTLTNYFHYYAIQNTIGAGSAVTNQYGYAVTSNMIGATNNYGFHGGIPSGTNRWNLYMAGTASNYMAGQTGIGTTTIGSTLQINGNAAIGYSASTAASSNGLKVNGRGNFLNATDNALFSLNSGGTLYTVGFSPTATASSTNTFTITNGTTTWIYTGIGLANWTLPNPSGNNQIYWIKNAGTGIITLNAFAGSNIIDNTATSVSSITIAVGATAVIAQDGNVKSYQLQ